jgi:hypothetical protein
MQVQMENQQAKGCIFCGDENTSNVNDKPVCQQCMKEIKSL